MRRRLLTLSSLLSLLLCVALNVVAPSPRIETDAPFDHFYHRSLNGRYVFGDLYHSGIAVGWSYSTSEHTIIPNQKIVPSHAWGHHRMFTMQWRVRSIWNSLGFFDFPMNAMIVFENGEYVEYHQVKVPMWFVNAVLLLLPLLWLLLFIRRVARRSSGRCRKCSYNLTGNTSGKCPECGTAVPTPTNKESPRPA